MVLWAFLGALGRSWRALGSLLGALGALLGRSWGDLGRSWGALARSWRIFDAVLEANIFVFFHKF